MEKPNIEQNNNVQIVHTGIFYYIWKIVSFPFKVLWKGLNLSLKAIIIYKAWYDMSRVIEKRKKSDLEQLMIICCVHVVKEIRKNTIREIIQGKLLKELTKYEGMTEFLNNIEDISIEAKIDNFPKENLNFSREM